MLLDIKQLSLRKIKQKWGPQAKVIIMFDIFYDIVISELITNRKADFMWTIMWTITTLNCKPYLTNTHLSDQNP